MTNATQYHYRLDAEIVTKKEGEKVARSWGVLDPEDEYLPLDDRRWPAAMPLQKDNARTVESFDEVREVLDRYGPIDRAFVWDRDDAFVQFAGRGDETPDGEPRATTMDVRGPGIANHLAALAKGNEDTPRRPTTRESCDSCSGVFYPSERAFHWYLFDGTHRVLCQDCGDGVVTDPESPGLIDDAQWVRVDDSPTDEQRRAAQEGRG